MENDNLQKNEAKKQKGRKGIIILIFILLIAVVIGYVVINMPRKEVEVYKEPEPIAIDLQNPIKILRNVRTDKVDIYNEKVELKLPGINATVAGAKTLNEKIVSEYSKIIEEAKKSTPYEVTYEYTYNTELRYLILNITTKLDSNIKIKTYIYDVKQDKEVVLSELYTKYNFSIDKLKSRLKYLNLVEIDILNMDNKKVEEEIFLNSIDKEKLVIGYINDGVEKTVTFNVNEKNAEYIVMDSINVKEDKGTSTIGHYKLYTNIKLPKIKLETTNATLLNNKINNIYTDIQEYYIVEENNNEGITNDTNIEQKQEKKELIHSYETNYKYGYINEIGCVYITITKKAISGKDDERSGEKQKIETEYISYVYNISEDKEEELENIFDLFGTSKEDIAKRIVDNNIKEKENIEKASENILNFSISSFSKDKLVIKLKVNNDFYEVEYKR